MNLSGLGIVRGTDQKDKTRQLIEFLLGPEEQQVFSDNNHEFTVKGGVDFKADPIDVAGAGAQLREALALMQEVGWD